MTEPETSAGFTLVHDGIVGAHGVQAALVYGVIYRYCQMRQGICYASASAMGALVGMTRQRFTRHLHALLQAGLVVDKTPNAVGTAHEYLAMPIGAVAIQPVTKCDVLQTVTPPVTDCNTPCNETLQVPVTKCNTRGTTRNTTQNTKETREAATPPARAAPLKRPSPRSDPRSKLPAIQCAKAANGGRYPPLALYDDIMHALGESPNGPRLVACRKAWVERGYNPNAWTWLTEWYLSGIPKRNGGNGHGPPGQRETVADRTKRVLAEYANGEQSGTDESVHTVEGQLADVRVHSRDPGSV